MGERERPFTEFTLSAANGLWVTHGPYRIMAECANMSGKTPYIFVLGVNFNHPDIDVGQARRLYREYLRTNIGKSEGLQK